MTLERGSEGRASLARMERDKGGENARARRGALSGRRRRERVGCRVERHARARRRRDVARRACAGRRGGGRRRLDRGQRRRRGLLALVEGHSELQIRRRAEPSVSPTPSQRPCVRQPMFAGFAAPSSSRTPPAATPVRYSPRSTSPCNVLVPPPSPAERCPRHPPSSPPSHVPRAWLARPHTPSARRRARRLTASAEQHRASVSRRSSIVGAGGDGQPPIEFAGPLENENTGGVNDSKRRGQGIARVSCACGVASNT